MILEMGTKESWQEFGNKYVQMTQQESMRWRQSEFSPHSGMETRDQQMLQIRSKGPFSAEKALPPLMAAQLSPSKEPEMLGI